jgi:DNA-binding transcriptional regulator YdaS (Cro superfamily)
MSKNIVVLRHLDRAISLAGSQSELARKIGLTQNAIWKAKSCGRISAEMAIRIEVALDGKVRREQLAPDIFCKIPKEIARLAEDVA